MSGLKDHFFGDELYLPVGGESGSVTLTRDQLPPYQSHSSTSREAAHSIAPRVTGLKQQVLDYFKAQPQGATDEQLIDALGMSASTLRPRRIELVDDGLLFKTQRYALTKSGRRATVWDIKQQSSQETGPKLWPPV